MQEESVLSRTAVRAVAHSGFSLTHIAVFALWGPRSAYGHFTCYKLFGQIGTNNRIYDPVKQSTRGGTGTGIAVLVLD
jgi:hypothetical protein